MYDRENKISIEIKYLVLFAKVWQNNEIKVF